MASGGACGTPRTSHPSGSGRPEARCARQPNRVRKRKFRSPPLLRLTCGSDAHQYAPPTNRCGRNGQTGSPGLSVLESRSCQQAPNVHIDRPWSCARYSNLRAMGMLGQLPAVTRRGGLISHLGTVRDGTESLSPRADRGIRPSTGAARDPHEGFLLAAPAGSARGVPTARQDREGDVLSALEGGRFVVRSFLPRAYLG